MKVKVEQSYKLLKKGNYHLYTEQFHFLIRMLSNDEKKCKKKNIICVHKQNASYEIHWQFYYI